jgi:Flp pilus assembly protein TadG
MTAAMANVIGTVAGEPGRAAQRAARTGPPSRRRTHRRVLWRSERGAVAAELVIATPLLLLLIMGVIQFALWEHAVHIATAVAQQGVSVGRLQGESAEAGQAEAQSVLDQLGTTVLSGTTITVTKTDQMTTVTVTGHAESIVGIFSLPVAATASGASESFTYPGQAP